MLGACARASNGPMTTGSPTEPDAPAATAGTPVPLPTVALPTPESGARVSIWLAWEPREMDVLIRLIDEFRQVRPDIQFEVVYFSPASLQAAYEAAAADGNAPSILIGPDEWGPGWWERSLVDDVAGLMARGLQARLRAPALSRVQEGSAVIGLPLEMQGVVLFANRAVYPRPASTVVQLVETMAASSAGTTHEAVLEMGARYAASFLATCEGEWMGEAGMPTLRGPAGLCWLELIQVLGSAGRSVFNSDADVDAFIAGRVPWLIAGTWQLDRLRQSIGDQALAIDPWPLYEATAKPLAGFVWTENAYLSSGLVNEDLEAAWTFLVYLLSPEAQRQLADLNGPAHVPAVGDADLADPLMTQAFASLGTGLPYPLEPAFAAYLQPIERAITAIRQGGAAPELVLERAEREILLTLASTPAPP
jgi:maltose-binding protein MalE